jgi:hypothetical protein
MRPISASEIKALLKASCRARMIVANSSNEMALHAHTKYAADGAKEQGHVIILNY